MGKYAIMAVLGEHGHELLRADNGWKAIGITCVDRLFNPAARTLSEPVNYPLISPDNEPVKDFLHSFSM